jgi:BspA type Leucine rich repeat region (6 copies)
MKFSIELSKNDWILRGMFKVICAVRLPLLLMLLTMPVIVQAQFTFTTNNEAITITGYNTAAGLNVVIPAATNGYPVGSIQYYTFSQSSLTSVNIPDSVTNIGLESFSDCTHLTNITVDAANPSYSSVGGVLFDKAQVTLLQFPGGIGGSYILPASVTSIGQYSFYSSSVTNVILLNSVTNIGQYAFYNCTSLASITLPNTLISIGQLAFWDCTSLTSVTIPNSVTSIGHDAFATCYSLTSLTIGNSVTSIGDDAFGLDSLIKTVTIPNSVTNIGQSAFGFNGLTNVTIGNGVTSIGSAAFANCASLLAVYFKGNPPSLGSAYVFNGDKYAIIYYLPGTMGWGPTFGGLPTVLWNPQAKTGDGSFGVQNDQFGFNITGSSNLVIVIEANTNLSNPTWIPVGTNTLNTFISTNGTSYFIDPGWTNYPNRFYRLRSP